MKVIEWAFLCASTSLDDRGGFDIFHLFDKFEMSDLPGLAVVFRLVVNAQDAGGLQPYPLFGNFLFSIEIKSEAQDIVEIYSAEEVMVNNQVLAVPIGKAFQKPGRYKVDLRVDGLLEHSLDLFLK